MCSSCWFDHGEPRIDNEGVRRAEATLGPLYDRHPVGGGLHVIMDDWNVRDSDIVFASENPLDEIERACLDAFRPLSEDERISALALNDRFWTIEEAATV